MSAPLLSVLGIWGDQKKEYRSLGIWSKLNPGMLMCGRDGKKASPPSAQATGRRLLWEMVQNKS